LAVIFHTSQFYQFVRQRQVTMQPACSKRNRQKPRVIKLPLGGTPCGTQDSKHTNK